jgi:hypothetical protein
MMLNFNQSSLRDLGRFGSIDRHQDSVLKVPIDRRGDNYLPRSS